MRLSDGKLGSPSRAPRTSDAAKHQGVAFHSGGIVMDEALKAAIAALVCSVGILAIGALAMVMLPISIG
jgi:hypothetical protein